MESQWSCIVTVCGAKITSLEIKRSQHMISLYQQKEEITQNGSIAKAIAANEKHALNMCSHSVSLLGKSDEFCTKKIVLDIAPSNLCVLQEKFGKIWPDF